MSCNYIITLLYLLQLKLLTF